MDEFYRPVELIPPEDAKLGGVTSEMARRWVVRVKKKDTPDQKWYVAGLAGSRMLTGQSQ
jgi:hypothetical protein